MNSSRIRIRKLFDWILENFKKQTEKLNERIKNYYCLNKLHNIFKYNSILFKWIKDIRVYEICEWKWFIHLSQFILHFHLYWYWYFFTDILIFVIPVFLSLWFIEKIKKNLLESYFSNRTIHEYLDLKTDYRLSGYVLDFWNFGLFASINFHNSK